MAIVRCGIEDGVGLVTMDNGENRHNPAFLAALGAALDDIEADPAARAVVIASSDRKYWSLGIDLDFVMERVIDPDKRQELRDFLYGLNRLFVRLLSYPMPVIAAIGGHAYGNGAIMACACDFRYMLAGRGFFCFPEVDVNIPFLPGMYAIVKKAVPAHLLNEMALTGRRLAGVEAAAERVVREACETPEALLASASGFARTFAKNRPIFREQKVRNHRAIIETIETLDPPLIEELKLVV